MPGDSYGMSPHGNGTSGWQDILNASWPPNPHGVKNQTPIDVTVRIAWEHDGEEHIEAKATRWTGRHVFVEFKDPRLAIIGAWVDAGDVVRR